MNRWTGVVSTVLVGLVTGACGPDTPGDGGGGPVLRSAWTTPAADDVAVLGDVVVATGDRTMRGLRRADGSQVWTRPYPKEGATLTLAGGLLVMASSDRGPVSVLDPASGQPVWTAPAPVFAVVRDDALYLDSCPDRNDESGCTVSKRRIADGGTLWTVADAAYTLDDDRIGTRVPFAPPPSAYLPVVIRVEGTPEATVALVDAGTGRLTAGRLPMSSWHSVAAGDTLVVSEHAGPGARDCGVAFTAVDGPTGAPAWSGTGTVSSGRGRDGSCTSWLGPPADGPAPSFFGSGASVVAVARSGSPTLVDLETGRPRWTAAERGVPKANDDHAVLVRELADTGPLALHDMADGRRLWTAPDPGSDDTSEDWRAVVDGRLTVVSGADGVLVYDTATGTELARRPGRVAGAGDGWVAVTDSTATTVLTL